MISVGAFLLLQLTAAGLLALWVAVRFPGLGPATLRAALAATAVALLGVKLLPFAVGPLTRLPGGAYVALFGGVLPCFVAVFLTLAWLMRLAAGSLGGSGGGGHRVPLSARR